MWIFPHSFILFLLLSLCDFIVMCNKSLKRIRSPPLTIAIWTPKLVTIVAYNNYLSICLTSFSPFCFSFSFIYISLFFNASMVVCVWVRERGRGVQEELWKWSSPSSFLVRAFEPITIVVSNNYSSVHHYHHINNPYCFINHHHHH